MSTSPLVSVMVPAYEQEHLIGATIESILLQDYPNLEIVVADDASTDRTADIVRAYAERHPGKIKLIVQEENVGVAANTSSCFAACSGEYVALFAGDDVMLPGKISRQVEYMEAHPEYVMTYHDVEVFDSESGSVLWHFNRGPRSIPPREGGAEMLVRYGVFSCGCSIMVRRNAAPPHLWDAAIPIASDWLFMIEVATKGNIGYIDAVLARYRKHRGGLTARPVGYDMLITLDIVDRRYPHFRRAARGYRRDFFHRLAARAFLQKQFRVALAYLGAFARALIGRA